MLPKGQKTVFPSGTLVLAHLIVHSISVVCLTFTCLKVILGFLYFPKRLGVLHFQTSELEIRSLVSLCLQIAFVLHSHSVSEHRHFHFTSVDC